MLEGGRRLKKIYESSPLGLATAAKSSRNSGHHSLLRLTIARRTGISLLGKTLRDKTRMVYKKIGPQKKSNYSSKNPEGENVNAMVY